MGLSVQVPFWLLGEVSFALFVRLVFSGVLVLLGALVWSYLIPINSTFYTMSCIHMLCLI